MTVDFKPIANSGGANVVTQAAYEAALGSGGELETGYLSGTARSDLFNKTVRQSAMMSAALATYIANTLSVDVLDDGDLAALTVILTEAIQQGWSSNTSLFASAVNYTVTIADSGRGVEMTGTHSVNLLTAATALGVSAGFSFVVVNGGTGKVTVALLTGTDKLDGVANGSYILAPQNGALFKLNAAGDGWVSEAWKAPYIHASDVASAATVNLDAVLGDFVHITGSTGINNITLSDGRVVWATTTGTPIIGVSGNILVPGAAALTSAAGDLWMFRGDGASVQAAYFPIAGLVKKGLYTASGLTLAAANRVLGRTTAGAGAAEELSAAGLISLATAGQITTSLTDARLAGRSAGSDGALHAITVGAGLSLAAGSLACTIATAAAATQAEMEAAASTAVFSSPARQQFHPGHPKAWCRCGTLEFGGAGASGVLTVTDSYNVDSVTWVNSSGVIIVTFHFAVSFSTRAICAFDNEHAGSYAFFDVSVDSNVGGNTLTIITNGTDAGGYLHAIFWGDLT